MEFNKVLDDQLKGLLPVPGKTGIDWYFFCWFLNQFKDTEMLEIGAGEGGSTLSMLSFAKHLTVIDSWEPGWPKHAVEKITNHYNLPVTFIDSRSDQVNANSLPRVKFVHLDANKDYHLTLIDLDLASSICEGVICVDDYLQSMWPEVTWAVDNWIQQSGWQRVLTSNHQVFLSKKVYPIKELVVNWPLINRGYGYHLTYGPFDSTPIVNQFINNGQLKYTWHDHQQ